MDLPRSQIPEQKYKKWSLKHDYCVSCKTTEQKHKARGLCNLCYDSQRELEHRGKRSEHGKHGDATNKMTYEFLLDRYVNKQQSLGEIAKECGCTRQLVYLRMKWYEIPLRNKSSARNLALNSDKLFFEREQSDGNKKDVVLMKQEINEGFFKVWTPAMAYVLGVIYTDGNMNIIKSQSRNFVYRVTVYQKEPELLEKVLFLMKCKTLIIKNPRRIYNGVVAGEGCFFHLNSETLFNDLLKLGVTPNKSLTMEFPTMPSEMERHFIRGCWDGDGSVFFNNGKLCASYVSGAESFIQGVAEKLFKIGIYRKKLISTHQNWEENNEAYKQLRSDFSENKYPLKISKETRSKSPSYCIRTSTKENLENLFHYFYDGVDETMYLKRKYDIFVKGLNISEEKQKTFQDIPYQYTPTPIPAKTTENTILKASVDIQSRFVQDTKHKIRLNPKQRVLKIQNADRHLKCKGCGSTPEVLRMINDTYCLACFERRYEI
ncbi:MAG: hypothetical protein EPN22_12115 [Nitrospirae bacterium]|nr:MAG: hypothetical protein EPN22_12115 [Nitrospirota bacterium]